MERVALEGVRLHVVDGGLELEVEVGGGIGHECRHQFKRAGANSARI